ncbi:MAG: glycerate kinase [Actinomycetota bacterium]|nr:glycerate kinase [Actinomycetota bacterium]
MRVVVAPDKFKGTLSALEAAEAIASGVRNVHPRAEVVLVPVADGGEGTCDLLVKYHGGESLEVTATDPLGRPIEANVWLLEGRKIGVEMAAASGLSLLKAEERDALRASSRGTGELARVGIELFPQADSLTFFIGGSASTDGGTGAARAFGWRFLDPTGRDLSEGGGSLDDLAGIDPPPRGLALSVLGACDVTSPLAGSEGAARLFAPQKGASSSDVERLETGLQKLGSVVERELGHDVVTLEGAGAGGGMGAGIAAFFDGKLVSGFDVVAEAVGLRDALDGADLVITGEGRLDNQSLAGKACGRVAELSRQAGVPCIAVAGLVALDPETNEDAGLTKAVQAAGMDPDPFRAVAAATDVALVDFERG